MPQDSRDRKRVKPCPVEKCDNYTASKVAQDLSPVIDIEGEQFVLETPLPGSFKTSELGPAIGTPRDEQDRIGAALDRLFRAY